MESCIINRTICRFWLSVEEKLQKIQHCVTLQYLCQSFVLYVSQCLELRRISLIVRRRSCHLVTRRGCHGNVQASRPWLRPPSNGRDIEYIYRQGHGCIKGRNRTMPTISSPDSSQLFKRELFSVNKTIESAFAQCSVTPPPLPWLGHYFQFYADKIEVSRLLGYCYLTTVLFL